MFNHTTHEEDKLIESARELPADTDVEPLIKIIERLDGVITKNGNDSNDVEEKLRCEAREARSRILALEAENKILSEKIDELAVSQSVPADFHGAAPRVDAPPPGNATWQDGYRLLTDGEVIAIGDQYFSTDPWDEEGEWIDVYGLAGQIVGDPGVKGYPFRRKTILASSPGEGYRLLAFGERLKASDDVLSYGVWTPADTFPDLVGMSVNTIKVRRRIDIDRQPDPV
jgi:hypothetical protein